MVGAADDTSLFATRSAPLLDSRGDPARAAWARLRQARRFGVAGEANTEAVLHEAWSVARRNTRSHDAGSAGARLGSSRAAVVLAGSAPRQIGQPAGRWQGAAGPLLEVGGQGGRAGRCARRLQGQ